MAAFLRCKPASDKPAPRPVISSGEQRMSAHAMAVEAVVFPMPISPVAIS